MVNNREEREVCDTGNLVVVVVVGGEWFMWY